MKVVWAILCQSSIIDRTTNNVSLINIIEEIQVVGPIPQSEHDVPNPELMAGQVFDFIIMFMRSDPDVPEKGRGRVQAIAPDGTEALPQEFDIDLSQYLRSRMVVKIPGLPIRGEGIYWFNVDCSIGSSDWGPPFELPVKVLVQAES